MNLRSASGWSVAAVAAATVIAVATVIAADDDVWDNPPSDRPTASPTPYSTPVPPTPDLHRDPADPPRPPLPDVTRPDVWASWAVMYLDTDHLTEGGEAGTSTTASLIKVGIAANYLRRLERATPARNLTLEEMQQLSTMIRDSDNDAAEQLYRAGGGDGLIKELISLCGLRDTTTRPGWWSLTRMSAADVARLGACVARGEVVSPGWTEWLLNEMRGVRGEGRFGITDAVPYDRGRPLATKNGWIVRDGGTWHVSCMAIADWWTMGVLARYPAGLGKRYGERICAAVAAALHPVDDEDARTPTVTAGVRA